ncbi:MAG: hypothetical protein Kow0031_28950 [Anaerolineae bacterium]
MNQPVTISAVVTTDLKRLLEEWAKQEDRTVSATLRQILAQEATRRQQRQNPATK